jgi:hypothetical protein
MVLREPFFLPPESGSFFCEGKTKNMSNNKREINMQKNYYNIKKAQQEEEVLSLLLQAIAELDSLVNDMVFSQGKIPAEIGEEINKRVDVAKQKIVQSYERIAALSFQKGLSRENA